MKFDLICFLFGLMIIPFSFLFFPKLYLGKKYWYHFFLVAGILAVIGLCTINFIDKKPNFYLFLVCPLTSLCLLRIQLYIFKSELKRNPIDPPRRFSFTED